MILVGILSTLLICTGFLSCTKSGPVPGPHPKTTAHTAYKKHLRTRAYWPTASWKTAKPETVGMSAAGLQKLEKYAFARTGNDKDRKGIRTDGLVIIKNGMLVYEKYARGYTQKMPHLSWSVSKSFTNALFGIAIRKGLFKLDDPAHKYYPLLNKPHHSKITLKQLLQMASGLFWNEGYEASPLHSSVLKMLYTAGRGNMAKFAAQQPVQYTPGTHWYYSSGTTNLLMGILQRTVTPKKYEGFIWRELFDRIGMQNVTWEQDNSKNFVGSSYLHASPRQLAKFGFLYLNDGIWEGKRVLPEGWVKFSMTASPANPKGTYGAQWWLNAGRPKEGIKPRWPDAPAETFCASGHWGQYILVVPSKDLVIVRTGDDRDGSFKRNTLLKLTLASIKTTKKAGGK